jgi:hypothetical protein
MYSNNESNDVNNKDKPKPNENNGNGEPVEEKSEKIYKLPGSDGKEPEEKLPPAPQKTEKKIPNPRNGI